MKKVECYVKNNKIQEKNSELQQTPYHWNGYLFAHLLDICIEENKIPEVAAKGELQQYINDYIIETKKKEQGGEKAKKISRNTFYEWCKDGGTGPSSDYIICLLDRLFPDIHFLRKPCTKSKKIKLYEIYTLAWALHYEATLLDEAEKKLYDEIQKVKQDYFHEKKTTKEELNKLHGKDYDEFIRQCPEDVYLCKLLDVFWEGYHRIFAQAELNDKYHAFIQSNNAVIFKSQMYHGKQILLDEKSFQEAYKDVLMKRQHYLEDFGDNLRTLFLGEDL